MASAVLLDYGLAIGPPELPESPFLTFDITDNLNFLDAAAIGYLNFVSDSMAASDDFIALGNFIELASDTLSMSASVVLNTAALGAGLSDVLNLSDSVVARYGFNFSDAMSLSADINFLIDVFELSISESAALMLANAVQLRLDFMVSKSDSISLTDLMLWETNLTITTASLPQAAVGQVYSATLTAAGGNPPYTWSLFSGSLPDGLSLSSDGVISGTPTTAETSNFTVEVMDTAGGHMRLAVRM